MARAPFSKKVILRKKKRTLNSNITAKTSARKISKKEERGMVCGGEVNQRVKYSRGQRENYKGKAGHLQWSLKKGRNQHSRRGEGVYCRVGEKTDFCYGGGGAAFSFLEKQTRKKGLFC